MAHELCKKFSQVGGRLRSTELLRYEEWAMLRRCLLDADKQPREELFDLAQVDGQAREMKKTYRPRLPETQVIAKLRSAYYSGLKKLEAYAPPTQAESRPEQHYYWQED